jgi:hypothetical protein
MKKLIFIILSFIYIVSVSHAAEFSAKAVVERNEVYMGEPFTFQIQVSGSDNPEKPVLSHVTDFTVDFLSGRQNSSQSITIINGKVTRNVREGYFFTYQLTPKKTGRLVIPSIDVSADGQSASTNPLVIRVSKPVETDDLKLRLNLSKKECYFGEPLVLTVKWYIGNNVRDFNFNLPVLESDDFLFTDMKVDTGSGKKLYRVQLGNREAIATERRERYENRDYVTLSFSIGLIPKRPGNITLETATVACSALAGYEKRQSNDLFSRFFDDDFFDMSRRGVYKKVVVPSNTPVLKVKELPSEGRPGDFTGYVGEYEIKANAEPLEVNVGDPITLTLSIGGPEFLEHVRPPDLNKQNELARNFKIPSEMASGEISGKEIVFTQTIRPKNSSVREIPSIEIPYFDTRLKKYRYAGTEPIPLNVDETKVVTLLDAEGAEVSGPAGNEIETLDKGIAFNYEDMTVMENERLTPLSWFESVPVLIAVFSPPLLYLMLFAGNFLYHKRNAEPIRIRAKKSYRILMNSLHKAGKSDSNSEVCVLVLEAFREYLGAKLELPSGAITFKDVKDRLKAGNIEERLIERLRDLFDACEAGRYAGDNVFSDGASIAGKGIVLAKELEKALK